MKIALICNSLLLKKALEFYLKDYISTMKECDFVVSDKEIDVDKPLFLIGKTKDSHLKTPFIKSDLKIAIKKFFNSLKEKKIVELPKEINKTAKTRNIQELERRLQALTNRYQNDLIKTIREFYEI